MVRNGKEAGTRNIGVIFAMSHQLLDQGSELTKTAWFLVNYGENSMRLSRQALSPRWLLILMGSLVVAS